MTLVFFPSNYHQKTVLLLMLLEICASNYQSAINAQLAGAHRIELCQELAVGGITPSYGLLKQVIEELSIPVFVLIRPRSGNFTYSDEEFEIMKKDIQICKDLGADGIVSGALLENNMLDINRTAQLVKLSKPLPFTFHRAFDWIPEPVEAIEQLISIGVDRVLTSGQQTSAEKGIDLLKKLQDQSTGRICILPGGGINSNTIKKFKKLGFKEVHASATKINKLDSFSEISMNSPKFLDDAIEYYSDTNIIRTLLTLIK